MMTIEMAISRLEDIVSGCYKKKFLKSELRRNTDEAVKQLKFDFMTMLKINSDKTKLESFNKVIDIVLDDTLMSPNNSLTYKEYCKGKKKSHTIMKYPDVLDECINCCNVIINGIADGSDIVGDDTMSVRELNRKYVNKYLYFRNDDIGSQYVWVKNIHKNTDGYFVVDGTVIFTNGVNNTIGLYDVQNYPIEDFYNFGDKENRFKRCEDLYNAINKPMDTRLKSHVVTSKEVAEDILFTFTWFYEIHIPDLAKILKGLKFTD